MLLRFSAECIPHGSTVHPEDLSEVGHGDDAPPKTDTLNVAGADEFVGG